MLGKMQFGIIFQLLQLCLTTGRLCLLDFSNPGAVLDHMLARYDAEIDGRSPRGAYATPARFADAMLADELGERGADAENPMPTGISLAALPPGFHALPRR